MKRDSEFFWIIFSNACIFTASYLLFDSDPATYSIGMSVDAGMLIGHYIIPMIWERK